MVTSTASRNGPAADDAYYYYQEDVDAAKLAQMQGFGWMEPIIIDDDDLMFGGKSLSDWYEEERKAQFDPEEERRGRQRVRQSPAKPSRHHNHQRTAHKSTQHGQEKQ